MFTVFNHLQILFFWDLAWKKNLVTYQFNLDSNKIIFEFAATTSLREVVVTGAELFEDQDNYSIKDKREYNILASSAYFANPQPLTDVQTQYFKSWLLKKQGRKSLIRYKQPR